MSDMSKKRRLYWKICCASALLVCALTFTPLVIPWKVYQPQLLGFPYSLWMGILVAVALVALTAIGARVHPKE